MRLRVLDRGDCCGDKGGTEVHRAGLREGTAGRSSCWGLGYGEEGDESYGTCSAQMVKGF